MFRAPKSHETSKFYDNLIDGSVLRYLWGAEERFDPAKIADSISTQKHFEPIYKNMLNGASKALDIGCSTGGFTSVLARYCEHVTGVDLSARAVDIANQYFQKQHLDCCQAVVGDVLNFDFGNDRYKLIQMVDVIHHVEDPGLLIHRVLELLDEGGRLVVFEPNKYNVLLFLMCLLDRNEWGALQFGSMNTYRKLLLPHFEIEHIAYNGLLIGPGSRFARSMADYFSASGRCGLLASQSPKVVLVLKRRGDC